MCPGPCQPTTPIALEQADTNVIRMGGGYPPSGRIRLRPMPEGSSPHPVWIYEYQRVKSRDWSVVYTFLDIPLAPEDMMVTNESLIRGLRERVTCTRLVTNPAQLSRSYNSRFHTPKVYESRSIDEALGCLILQDKILELYQGTRVLWTRTCRFEHDRTGILLRYFGIQLSATEKLLIQGRRTEILAGAMNRSIPDTVVPDTAPTHTPSASLPTPLPCLRCWDTLAPLRQSHLPAGASLVAPSAGMPMPDTLMLDTLMLDALLQDSSHTDSAIPDTQLPDVSLSGSLLPAISYSSTLSPDVLFPGNPVPDAWPWGDPLPTPSWPTYSYPGLLPAEGAPSRDNPATDASQPGPSSSSDSWPTVPLPGPPSQSFVAPHDMTLDNTAPGGSAPLGSWAGTTFLGAPRSSPTLPSVALPIRSAPDVLLRNNGSQTAPETPRAASPAAPVSNALFWNTVLRPALPSAPSPVDAVDALLGNGVPWGASSPDPSASLVFGYAEAPPFRPESSGPRPSALSTSMPSPARADILDEAEQWQAAPPAQGWPNFEAELSAIIDEMVQWHAPPPTLNVPNRGTQLSTIPDEAEQWLAPPPTQNLPNWGAQLSTILEEVNQWDIGRKRRRDSSGSSGRDSDYGSRGGDTSRRRL